MSAQVKLYDWHSFGRHRYDGALIGVEIEVEGTNLPRDMSRTGWTIHEDGSLRGESAEYVFSKPVNYERANAILDKFAQQIATATSVNMSYRTSVHVHVNVQDMTFNQIYNMILLYILYEDQFGEMAGDHRIGNLFCLRAKDAKGYIATLRQAAARNRWNDLGSNHLRYSACNTVALFQHGTLEFRAMRGTTDTNLIRRWYTLLLRLRHAATELFRNPQDILQQLANRGIEGFTQYVFDEQPFPHNEQFYASINEHIPMLEFIAYAQEWGEGVSVINPAPTQTPMYSINELGPAMNRAPNQPRNVNWNG